MFRITRSHLIKASIGAIVAVLLFLAGYLPEHIRRLEADGAEIFLRAQLDRAEARLRVGDLLGQALMLRDLAVTSDFGTARRHSSEFFDAVRQETRASQEPEFQQALSAVLDSRDAITAGLATSDRAVTTALALVERHLRAALSYPVTSESTTIAQDGERRPL